LIVVRKKTIAPKGPLKPGKKSVKRAEKPASLAEIVRTPAATKPFPIVALGASAGGLEALEKFIAGVPSDSGLAFIAVTHQHPGHVSMLPELLRKHAKVRVEAVTDGAAIEPNCFYLSSSEGYLAIFNGALHIVEPDEPGLLRLPIDYFFRSLAEDRKETAIGIVLSGTGTDGTLGLKAIKGAAGMTMAQDPESAKYSGMPCSAVDAGLVDYILPVEQMPRQLLAYVHGPFLAQVEPEEGDDAELSEPMQKINLLLRARTGNDFSAYKPNTIRRRIERRINIHQLKGPQQYLHFLQQNPNEMDLVFSELLIGVTHFFRDPEAFDAMAKTVLPAILSGRPDNSAVRVWAPGCATGEEAYSLAILLQEGLDRIKRRLTAQIFGTDLDRHAITTARAGFYPEGIARDVRPKRLARFFVKENDCYRIKKEIREMVVFATQNVLKDPPFTKLDMISCRNLLIYFKPEAQRRLLELFHYALKPGGILFLGPSESIGDFGGHFAMGNKKWKIFVRKGAALTQGVPAGFSSHFVRPEIGAAAEVNASHGGRKALLSTQIEKMLLKAFVPTSVIVNERGDIAYIHGRTGDFLEAAAGHPRLNVLEMAREGLRIPLGSALRRAAGQKGEVVQEGVRVKTTGDFANVRLTATKLTEPESIRDMLLVTFQAGKNQKPPPAAKSARRAEKLPADVVPALERELQDAKETLQSTVEQLESSNEELKSTNEEMQSTNEELQSVNEELETSKEEMQSLNEELQTVNAELQAKVDDLGNANDDMQNLLNSTEIATIFLDQEFKIKRFTSEATKLINLIPSDVGRPISHLASNLDYEQLQADADEVMRKLGFKEREVRMKSGEWRQVRITPYRTTENVIDGLVITFIDINRIKRAEEATQRGRAYAESIVATVRQPLVVLDEDLRVISTNKAFTRAFKMPIGKIMGHIIYEANHRQWAIPRLRKLLEDILPQKTTLEDFEVSHIFQNVGPKTLLINARRLERESGMPGMILLAIEDKTAGPASARNRPVRGRGRVRPKTNPR
jgi:two-component system CheB/CheR fusion protein